MLNAELLGIYGLKRVILQYWLIYIPIFRGLSPWYYSCW